MPRVVFLPRLGALLLLVLECHDCGGLYVKCCFLAGFTSWFFLYPSRSYLCVVSLTFEDGT